MPRLGNPHNPIDDLVYIMLSNKTGPSTANKTYWAFKELFSDWSAVATSPIEQIADILRHAGLATVKSQQIRNALMKIQNDAGVCSLGWLQGFEQAEIEKYLVSLPGVSLKVAKCVMLYSMGKEVLPVDSHVHRVSRRLGWTQRKRADQCHEELESIVSPRRRMCYHVGCIEHGRAICKGIKPNCDTCCIADYCVDKGVCRPNG